MTADEPPMLAQGMPADAVWIPAIVRESRTATFHLQLHWQPYRSRAATADSGNLGSCHVLSEHNPFVSSESPAPQPTLRRNWMDESHRVLN